MYLFIDLQLDKLAGGHHVYTLNETIEISSNPEERFYPVEAEILNGRVFFTPEELSLLLSKI